MTEREKLMMTARFHARMVPYWRAAARAALTVDAAAFALDKSAEHEEKLSVVALAEREVDAPTFLADADWDAHDDGLRRRVTGEARAADVDDVVRRFFEVS